MDRPCGSFDESVLQTSAESDVGIWNLEYQLVSLEIPVPMIRRRRCREFTKSPDFGENPAVLIIDPEPGRISNPRGEIASVSNGCSLHVYNTWINRISFDSDVGRTARPN